MTLTRALAWAAATDAANASMKAAGRAAWNADDYAVACATFGRLWPERKVDGD